SQTSSQGGGGATGSSGGAPRLARASPSLLQSGVGSPGITLSSQSTQGAGQAGQLSKIVIAQVFLLLSSIKEDKDKTKWDNQVEQIRKLVDSNGMDVYEKYFRRLVQANAPKIFPGSGGSIENPGCYRILVDEMKVIAKDQEKVNRMVEAIDTTEGDVFRDFDLSTFMEHFRLDPLAKTALALAFKTASKPDLRMKADAILSNNLQPFFATLASPTEPAEGVEASYLAVIVERLLQDPPRNWNEENKTSLG
ncbi:CCR4-NOT core subunit cdc39, partial [Cryomyces antarcticus]